jgi:hypothetical protein
VVARVVSHRVSRLERKVALLRDLPAHDAVEELVPLLRELYSKNRRPVGPGARRRVIAIVEALLFRYPRGIFKPSDPGLAASLLVHSVLGVIEATLANPLDTSDEALTHELSALTRRYLFSD